MCAERIRSQNVCLLAVVLSSLIPVNCRFSGLKQIDVSYSLHVESEALNGTRDIFIHLPEGYERSEKRYPVLCVLDAEDVFSYAAGAVDFLSTARMPEMIVVGIPNTNRERDIWVDLENPDGGYVRFIQFLEKELIPTIDARYRTQPYRVFYGFCSGASMVFWLLFNKPDMFAGYIASGTGFDETWADLAVQAFAMRPELKKSLFAVTEGTTPRALGMPLLRSVLEKSAPPGLSWDCQVLEGEEHGPVLARGLFSGLQFVFKRWRPPVEAVAGGSEAIKKHYAALSMDYGFDIGLPVQPVLSAASSLFWQGDRKAAMELFRYLAETATDSPDVHETLGMAYEVEEQYDLAENALEAAVRIADKTADRRLPTIEERLKNLRERLWKKRRESE